MQVPILGIEKSLSWRQTPPNDAPEQVERLNSSPWHYPFHHRAVGQVPNPVEAGYRRHRGSRANLDKSLIGR
jgi:hypothetical protein